MRVLQGNGYSTGGLRQVAPDPRPRAGHGRPLRPLAERLGLRPLLGLPRRRVGPVRPGHHSGQHDHRRARGRGRRRVLPARRPHRQVRELAARRAGPGRDQALVRLLLHRLQPRAAPGGGRVERQVQGQVRLRLGRLPRGDLRPPEEARRDPRRRRAHPAARRAPRVGLALGGGEEALRPSDGGLRRLLGERRLERRPAARRRRGDGRARRHARPLHLGRQRRQPRGHAHGLVQRAHDAERRAAHVRAAALADRAIWRAGRLGHRRHGAALRRRLGLGEQLPLPVGQAGRQPPRRHAQSHGRRLAAAHRDAGDVPSVHPRHRRRADDPRGGRHPRSQGRRRHRADADGGNQLPLHLRRRDAQPSATRSSTSRSSATGPSTRTAGGPVPRSTAYPGTSTPATMARLAPDKYDPENDTWELYYLPDDFSQAKDLAAQKPEKLAELKELFWEEAGEVQGAAAAGRLLGVLRHPAAPADHHEAHVLRRRRERPRGHAPEDLRPLLRDLGRPPRARGRRRRRDRGRGGRDGRLLPVRPGRQAPPHLQHDGRRGLPPGVHRDAARRAT